MADTTLSVDIQANIAGLLDALKVAKDAINKTFETAEIDTNQRKPAFTELFKAVESSSDRAVSGLVKGTQTWHQAMVNVIRDIEIKFIQLGVRRLLNWVETELGMTQATAAGNAARAASDETASNSGLALQAGKAISAILNDAKQVFGGIFAFLAPVMGPAAAGPAATASASVAALTQGIVYAENGAWNIPANTLAYLHAGEMVVPQSFASHLRDGNGFGGGDSYTINIHAIDTQTGAQFLKRNASAIASTLSSQARNFNRHVPVWKA